MIIPGLFRQLFKGPELNAAWVFVFLNVGIFLFSISFFEDWPSSQLVKKISDKNLTVTLSEMYLQTLDPIEKTNMSHSEAFVSALRDHRFWKRAHDFPFRGDVVQIQETRGLIKQFQQDYLNSAQYQMGLGNLETSPWAWVTYQFSHASLTHLLSNLIFVFLIVSFLESFVGFYWIASVYLLGGLGGGISYLLFDDGGSLAVVGASASVCALMSFLVIIKKDELMPWSYFIAPIPEGYGAISLPVFFIFPLFLMSDFISILTESTSLSSSIAVSAHVGGAFAGLLLGIIFKVESKLLNHLRTIWQI